ncbi:MAG: DUF2480 family protein [Flavobacteriales bacterium]
MEKPIINRVANSKLITIDLEDFYPEGKRISLDISQWLFNGIVLKEKEFRSQLQQLNLSKYKNSYIALYCSSEAIIPSWAYMLVSLTLTPIAKKVIVGNLEDLETLLYTEIITNLNTQPYKNKAIIIKGCSNKVIPQNAYVLLAQKLEAIAKSIMYGEACSAVPLYKMKK